MQIDHVALWTKGLERSLEFYARFFGGEYSSKYVNPSKQLETYFVYFRCGPRLELMRKPDLVSDANDNRMCGWAHIAFFVGSTAHVDAKARSLRLAGYLLEEPRWTGDGYYEAVAADPDGNRIEIVSFERRKVEN